MHLGFSLARGSMLRSDTYIHEGGEPMTRAGPMTRQRPSLYERDFYLWIEQQASWLREGRLDEIDVANLLEEIEDMGRSEKRGIESNLVVLLTHLLKYQLQPDQRSSGWRGSIVEHRRRMRKLLRDSPSLAPYARAVFAECYADSCEQAAAESGLSRETFPGEPPFTLDQVLDPRFLPE
jgi:hypothetical protein